MAVTLYGTPSDTDWGNLGATVYRAAAAGPQCSTVADTALADIHQASTKPDSTSIYGAIWLGGFRPAGSLSKGFGPDPNTITLQTTDAELGRGTYDAEPGEQASARVRLTAAARWALARRKRLVVRIAVTASSPGATTARRSKRALIVPTSSRSR